ncbi:MAG: DUF4402 domain-containing protein [Alphaproteobacteria bacterium]|nr:DUF4402 domain-containing protein [Alphaproteobacteria bacterium]
MRKYFLLSAVALMSASNVMAASESGTFQAKAQVNIVNHVTCSDMDFGTIYLKAGNARSTIYMDAAENIEITGDITSYTGQKPAKCTLTGTFDFEDMAYNLIIDDKLELTGGTGDDYDGMDGYPAWIDSVSTDVEGNEITIGGTLNIPAKFTGGTLTGTFTFTIVE